MLLSAGVISSSSDSLTAISRTIAAGRQRDGKVTILSFGLDPSGTLFVQVLYTCAVTSFTAVLVGTESADLFVLLHL